jgi:hypothetical protein
MSRELLGGVHKGPAFAKLRRVRRPRAPEHLPAEVRAVWRRVAPQVCEWSPVTRLDIGALAVLVSVAHYLQQPRPDIETARLRRKYAAMLRQRRALLWELCQAFLIPSPEVLEQITLPDGVSLLALVRGNHDASG